MPSNYKSEIQTWEDADKYLGSKDERPLPHCANLRIGRAREYSENDDGVTSWKYGPAILVTLHGNTIVRFPGPGLDKEFPYRGHFTNFSTTKRHRSAFGGPWKV